MSSKQLLLAALLSFAPLSAQGTDAPLDLGVRRELFVDRALIDSWDGARLELARPRDEGPVFRFDRPWEGPFCGYATVVADGGRFLLYYRGLPTAGGDGTDLERTCVAISEDGRRFRRPELTQFDVPGAASNNVVMAGAAPVSHNFSPFLDGHVADAFVVSARVAGRHRRPCPPRPAFRVAARLCAWRARATRGSPRRR